MAIDALDIEIRHKSEGADDAVQHLVGSLGKLEGILRNIGSAIRFPQKASEAMGSIANASNAVSKNGGKAVAAAKQQSAALQSLQMQYDQVRRRIDLYQGVANRSKAWGERNGETEDNINTRIQAIEKLQELTKQRYDLEMQLQSATSGAAEATRDAAAAAEENASAQQKLLPLLRSTAGVSAFAEKAFGRMQKTLKAMGRMVFMRAIRAAIRMVTSNVKEGVKNLAEFDRATGQMTSVGAIQTLSAYGQKFLELKNAVGAAAMPLMQALLPVIQTITGWFIAAANAVNALIRALQGFSTFFKAGTADGYDYADSMNAAAGGASKLKNTILGFDELNVMDSPSGGGGGGGSSSWGGLSAEDLFGEFGINQSLRDFATSLKLTVKDVFLDWDNWGVEAFLETLVVGLGAITGGIIGFAAGGVGGAILGITIGAVLGITFDALIFNHDGKVDANELIKTLGTILTAALGGFLAYVFVGTGMGVVIGVGVALALVVGRLLIDRKEKAKLIDQFYETDLGKELLEMQKELEAAVKVAAEIEINIKDRENTVKDLEYVEKKAKGIVDELVRIQDSKILTQAQVKRVKDLMGQLNALGLDGLMSHYDEATGRINLTEDAIRQVIQAQLDQAQTTAYLDLYTEALKDQLKIEQQLYAAKSDQERIDQELIIHAARRDALWEIIRHRITLVQEEYDRLRRQGVQERDAWERATEKYKNYAKGVTDEYAAEVAAVEELTRRQGEVNATVAELEGKWKDVNDEVTYYRDHANASVDTKIEFNQQDLVKMHQELAKEFSGLTFKLGFKPYLVGGTVRTRIDTGTAQQTVNLTFAQFAEGGFPTPGQLFFANEAGPELVGTMGGRTAVANSDQIIAGIASGVAAAMAGTGAKLDRTNDLLQGIAEKDATVTVSTADIAAGMVRMNRRAGATVMPVGA